mmetsp:Transcript_19242/g.58082  ORF Transcript_19242/g.58082 Transcript_19242/m.58082 type:complete len:315 (+) Transcript_19242:593-1537(+)
MISLSPNPKRARACLPVDTSPGPPAESKSRPSNSFTHSASKQYLIMEMLGSHFSALGTLSAFTYTPPNTMKITMIAGPMARAASVEGAIDPTAKPSAEDVKLSRVRMPRNLANLDGLGLSPVRGYTTTPKRRGNMAPTGSSAASLARKYGSTWYAFLDRSRVTMVRSRGNTLSVFIRLDIAALMEATCSRPIRSWMVVWLRRMRQKMAPKMSAEEMLVPARAMLVALSRVACLHDRASSSLNCLPHPEGGEVSVAGRCATAALSAAASPSPLPLSAACCFAAATSSLMRFLVESSASGEEVSTEIRSAKNSAGL